MKTKSLPQLELPIARRPGAPRHSGHDVSDEVIETLQSMGAAIQLAQTVAGLNDQQICAAIQIDPGQWTRIKGGTAHFPHDKFDLFMDACGNEIPLRYLAAKRGKDVKPRLSALEEEVLGLRIENAELRREISIMKSLFRETRG